MPKELSEWEKEQIALYACGDDDDDEADEVAAAGEAAVAGDAASGAPAASTSHGLEAPAAAVGMEAH